MGGNFQENEVPHFCQLYQFDGKRCLSFHFVGSCNLRNVLLLRSDEKAVLEFGFDAIKYCENW